MTADLSRLLTPTSVAVAGLSADSTKHGAKVVANLRTFGFEGAVLGVNPKLPEVPGVEVVASLDDLPEPPDVVVVAVPAAAAVDVVRAAGRVGAGSAILFAGGFAEAGSRGAELQAQVREVARDGGVRLLGPNSAGVINPSARAVMSFLTCLERPADQLRPGPVALVTQSGGTGSYLHNLAAERGSGFALSISTGNEADVEVAEALEYLLAQPDVRAVAVVLETVRNGPRFVAAARAALEAGKPVVVCKLGRSESGHRVMRTHTGALAGPHRRYQAVFAGLGITEVETPAELLDVAELMARTPVPNGDRVGIVTHSGGTAVLLADLVTAAGLSLPQPSEHLREQLGPYLQQGAAGNPTDLGGIITEPSRYVEVVRQFVADRGYDAVVPVSTPHPRAATPDRARALAELCASTEYPMPNLWLAGDVGAEGLDILRRAGVPVSTDVRSLVTAVRGLVQLGAARRSAYGDEPVTPDPDVSARLGALRQPEAVALSEPESKRVVADLGLPVVAGEVVTSGSEARRAAAALGYPVALKVVSRDVPHKTEAGGVRLGLRSAPDVTTAWDEIVANVAERCPHARVEGMLVERYVPGVEMILGVARDAAFGPLVLAGTGGTLAEAIDDVSVALPPLTRDAALRMVASLRGRVLLDGYRGAERADVEALAGLLVRLSQVAVAYEDVVQEIDLNPTVFSGGRWQVVDALVRLRQRR